MKFFLLLSILILFIAPAYAEVISLSSDKSEYHDGDTIIISGQVNFDPELPPFTTIQIFSLTGSFVDFDQAPVNSDGSFSITFHAGGPTWPSDGTYTVKATYGGPSETTFNFSEISQTSEESISNEETSSQNEESIITTSEQPTSSQSIPQQTQKPKTHIPGFPSLDKSPQYYIDRYNNEPDYESWFNSQFPGQSIYEVLGFPDPVQVPNWIKITAEWWSTGKINDSDFLDGIEFMIKNDILVIPYLPEPGALPNQDVPDWIRNTASWWAQDKISEEEFLNGIKFLIQSGIILV